MNSCFFVSNLHGNKSLYRKLFGLIKKARPDFVFIGGDLLPNEKSPYPKRMERDKDLITDFLLPELKQLRHNMECAFPEIMLIPGSDDNETQLEGLSKGEAIELWLNLHNRCRVLGKFRFYGYAGIGLKPLIRDTLWSPDDKSGSVSTPDGTHLALYQDESVSSSIVGDLKRLSGDDGMDFGIFLLNTPCINKSQNSVQLHNKPDLVKVHAGSVAAKQFIEIRQPYITMHNFPPLPAALNSAWKQQVGRTWCFTCENKGDELSVIRFNLNEPGQASMILV
jgi:uncharacterized protein